MGSEVVKHLFKATTDLMHGIINVNVTEVGRCDSACNWCFESFNLHPKKGTDWQFKNVPIMNQSNCFISIRVMVDMEAIPGTPGTRQGHTLNPASRVWELLHSIVYLLNCTGFNKTRNLASVSLLHDTHLFLLWRGEQASLFLSMWGLRDAIVVCESLFSLVMND